MPSTSTPTRTHTPTLTPIVTATSYESITLGDTLGSQSTPTYKYEPEGMQDKPHTISEIIDYANLHDISLPIILTALLMSRKYLHARKKGAENSVDVSKIDSAQLAAAVVELVVSGHYDVEKVVDMAKVYASSTEHVEQIIEAIEAGQRMLTKHEQFGLGGKAPPQRIISNLIFAKNRGVFTDARARLTSNPPAIRFLDDCIKVLDALNRIQ